MGVRLAAAVLSVLVGACGGGSTASTPTSPTPTQPPVGSSLVIVVTGALYTLDGALIEATILLDGTEIPTARATCSFSGGCISLLLNPFTEVGVPVTPGQHTISFQVLRHSSAGRVAYTATGAAVVGRGQTAVQTFTLPERGGALGARESITYPINVTG